MYILYNDYVVFVVQVGCLLGNALAIDRALSCHRFQRGAVSKEALTREVPARNAIIRLCQSAVTHNQTFSEQTEIVLAFFS